MSRIGLAFRAFFAALFSAPKAELIRGALSGEALPKLDSAAKTQPPPQPAPPARSEAITLLSALQREARLVDLVKQPLAEFSDEQVGAAARNVLGDAAAVLDRFFGLKPVVASEEGATCLVPTGYDPGKFKLGGNVAGSGPFRGTLTHHGWQATAVKLPAWTGSHEAALIIAPAEVDV